MLREALSHNASPQMKSIVETIQRQQDMIIRDTLNELVFVQGVAGSGKTSVALHRVAFLLYEGVTQKLYANKMCIRDRPVSLSQAAVIQNPTARVCQSADWMHRVREMV